MKNVRAIQLKSSGECRIVTINDYKDLNRYAGCSIGTTLSTRKDGRLIMWLDDEGLLVRKPLNRNAVKVSEYPGYLAGDAVLLRTDYEGDNTNLTDEDIEFVKETLCLTEIEESE